MKNRKRISAFLFLCFTLMFSVITADAKTTKAALTVKIAQDNSSITLAWTPVNNASSYKIFCTDITAGSNKTEISKTFITTTRKTKYRISEQNMKQKFTPGSIYRLEIVALNKNSTALARYTTNYRKLSAPVLSKYPQYMLDKTTMIITAYPEWKESAGASGYKLQWVTGGKNNFKNPDRIHTVNLPAGQNSFMIHKLKMNRTCSIRIQAFSTVNGRKCYSSMYTRTYLIR